jgi:hypothetical protein
MMDLPPGFLLRIAKAANHSEEGPGAMTIIIHKPYTYLKKELLTAFEGQEEVVVIVDRRYGERRKNTQHAAMERRKADRRTLKEEMLEVLIPA